MRQKRLADTRGFTLIELLMVLAIMGILASLLIGAYQGIKERMRGRLAAGDLERLASACEMYCSFHGSVPVPDGDETENFEIYEQLQYMGGGGDVRRRTKPLQWNQERLNGNGSMVDPWGKPYRFKMVDEDMELPEPDSDWWVDDDLPAGAAPTGTWNWISASPEPYAGTKAHQSDLAAGTHQHYFTNATDKLKVEVGDQLGTRVYLDPANPPQEVMLQFNDGDWEHRAYWGANSIDWGTDGTESRKCAGALPAAGEWVQLTVAASQLGLEGAELTGMAFALYNGRATFDAGGVAPLDLGSISLPVYRIYSCGPNGTDDDGTGDDIVRDVVTE